MSTRRRLILRFFVFTCVLAIFPLAHASSFLQVEQCLPVPESCDGIDNDCDGIVDEGDGQAFDLFQGGVKLGAVAPLTSSDTVQNLYNYGAPVPSSYNGIQPGAQSNTSLIFIHTNAISLRRNLVVVHDAVGDGSGGSAQMSFYNLGNAAELTVADDPVEVSMDDFGMAHDAHLAWEWADCCTDGAAIGELTFTDGCITVEANFIEGIASWQFLSGSMAQPEVFALDMAQPLQICPEVCNDCPVVALAEVPSEKCVSGLVEVQLDASDSYDPTQDELSYTWYIDGEMIFGNEATNTLLLAPGQYDAQVVVSDGLCQSTKIITIDIVSAQEMVLSCPADKTVELSGETCSASGSSFASLMDPCVGDVQKQTKFYMFGETGDMELTYEFFDDAGESHMCVQTITAIGPSKPEIVVETPVNILWAPNHKCVDLSLEASCGVSATLPCVDAETVDIDLKILSITSDELHETKKGGDGHTSDDIEITGDTTFKLRAERLGAGDGRVYTVIFEAIGPNGEATTDQCQFMVPHDTARSPFAGDDGVAVTCEADDECVCGAMPGASLRAKRK